MPVHEIYEVPKNPKKSHKSKSRPLDFSFGILYIGPRRLPAVDGLDRAPTRSLPLHASERSTLTLIVFTIQSHILLLRTMSHNFVRTNRLALHLRTNFASLRIMIASI